MTAEICSTVESVNPFTPPPGFVRVPPKASSSLITLTKKYDIILGSSSKWRRTVLEASGCRCVDIIAPEVDEKSIRGSSPLETTYKITKAKADAIMDEIGDSGWTGLLVCSDQVSLCDGECREKPVDAAEARRFIRSYTDDGLPVTTVSTMVVVDIETGKRAYGNHQATVRFAPIPPSVVDRLVEPGHPIYTCSGGFSIDDPIMGQYCISVDGGVDAVMGMPLGLLEKLIVEVTSETNTQ
ncbi:maf protein, putative [Perkinsus marinus ATCC 50983]|uniref:Maf protein, putative n=1 Tax=Perkinsus marinus (strain ATCC 50983 / TXsc) TaxID=423536 RepID=C5KAH1_PERM5|nr:maf protein, putative [Perkinsus marinus ATCC 50983]EER18507.1 maf protein, putative [Perkinsus marinus ATCC 50983]|eukprot:XP_002786711.1 maf protein, putative [Perkinsus marinus ATCC 50983]